MPTVPSIRSGFPDRLPLAAGLALVLAGAAAGSQASGLPSSAPGDRDASSSTPTYRLRLQVRARADRAGAIPGGRVRLPAGSARDAPGNVLPVTSCADDGSPGTLRSVVAAASEHDTVDLAQLTCSTITLTSGPIDSSMLGDNGLYYLTVQGPGESALTIDGGDAGQVFVGGGFNSGKGRLELRDLTVAHGTYTHGLAGCIEVFGGTLALDHVTVTQCSASNGGPLTFGGAVDTTDLEMTSSTISDSTSAATGDNVAIGGGAYAMGNATLIDSTISGNQVTADIGVNGTYLSAGGGLYVRGDLSLTNSTIDGNTITAANGGRGGGVFTRGYASVIGSSVTDNQADGAGGGLYKAIFSNYGDPFTTLTIQNSTFAGNSSGADGGGVVSTRPSTIDNSTIAFNIAAASGGGIDFADGGTGATTLDLESTLIASNDAPVAADFSASAVPAVNGADNLVMVADPAIVLPGDTLADDPLLQPLADNGGPTQTLALDGASPAIDHGNNVAALATDQRGDGFPRVAGAAADIGAYEVQSPGSDDIVFVDGFDGGGRSDR